MTWADQQRKVPPPGKDYASHQARRAWLSAGAGPFGIADVGLPPASGAMAGLPSPEPRPSDASGGAGLPPAQFLQQPPGSASFLDASTQVSVREVVPVVGTVAPVGVPLWRMGPGGGLPVGLRVPFGEVLSPTPFLESPFSFERVTGFDPEWGEPPTVEALTWNPERALYEPSDDPRLSGSGVSGYTGSAHVPGYLKHFHAHYVDMASRQAYVQAYRQGTGTGSWSFQWVRATTPWPEVTALYEVMGPYERFALSTAEKVVPPSGDPPSASTLSRPARGEPYATLTPRTIEYREPVIRPKPPVEPTLQDFAWVPQRLLPVGCPYPEAYLPVPLADYTSGRWLEVDYTPSLPLPRPYNQLPAWRCGVVGTEGGGRGKGGGTPTTPADVPHRHVGGGGSLPSGSGGAGAKGLDPGIVWRPPGGGGAPGLTAPVDMDDMTLTSVTTTPSVRGTFAARVVDAALASWDAHKRLATLEQAATELEEQLRNPALSGAERTRLEAELRRARLALAQADAEVRAMHERGQLPGPAPAPSSVVLRARLEAAKKAAGEARTQAEAEKAAAEIEELRKLGFGEEGYSPGGPSSGVAPPGAPPDIVAKGGGPVRPAPPVVGGRRKPRADALLPRLIARAARMLTGGRSHVARSLIAERERLNARLRGGRLGSQDRMEVEDTIRDIEHQLRLLGLPATASLLDVQRMNSNPLRFPSGPGHTALTLEPSSSWEPFTLGTTKRTNGIKTKAGVSSADAIDEIFSAPETFEIDCAGASALAWLKATLDTMVALDPEEGRRIFDKAYPTIDLHADKSTLVANTVLGESASGRMGDLRTIANPNSSIPAFLNENFLLLKNGDVLDGDSWNHDLPVFAHPFGETTVSKTVEALKEVRELPKDAVAGDELEDPYLTDNHRRVSGPTIEQQVARGP